jgi:hypothetical protein
VTNGIEAIKIMRRMAGESARRKGLATRSCDVRSRIDDVEWILRGRSIRRRAVINDRTRGITENKRKLYIQVNRASGRYNNWCDSPNRLAPRWLLVTIPHETANESPHSTDEERDWYEYRSCNHNGLDEYAQESDMHIGNCST